MYGNFEDGNHRKMNRSEILSMIIIISILSFEIQDRFRARYAVSRYQGIQNGTRRANTPNKTRYGHLFIANSNAT